MQFFKKARKHKDSYLIIALTIAIVMALNYISTQRFLRADLSDNQLYALSDASQTIVEELEDIVTIKVFFSKKLPPNLFAVRQYVQDILGELNSYSRGNLNIFFLDPSEPQVKEEALNLGIPQVQMNIVEKDKLEVKNGFLGIAIQYGEKVEILPVVQNIMNIEYDLVASIKKVTSQNEKKVGFITGFGEPKLETGIKINKDTDTLSLLREALDRNYQVETINLKQVNKIEGVETVLLIGAKEPMSSTEVEKLQNFIAEGGNVVIMTDPLVITGDLEVRSNIFDANQITENYNIEIKRQLVLDRSNERASFNQGLMSFVLPYPLWIKALNENFEPANPIVANLESAIFPWTSPIIQKNSKALELIKTTENAWRMGNPFELEPNQIQNSKEKIQSTISTLLKPNKNSGYLLVVSNARFITDRFIQMYPQNLLFGMNAIDFLTLDQSLINIRSKTSFEKPLKELNVNERAWAKNIGTFLMPLLVIAFGIARYFMRKRILNNLKY